MIADLQVAYHKKISNASPTLQVVTIFAVYGLQRNGADDTIYLPGITGSLKVN